MNDCIISENLAAIIKIIEELNNLKDVDAILDKILFESRRLTCADAGSIFLVDGDGLRFSYVQNDTLFNENEANTAQYEDFTIPISEESVVGYVASTGSTVSIDDAYALPPGLPYSFNSSFDRKSGYHTKSILAMPLTSLRKKLVGVIQLINAVDYRGNVVPFSEEKSVYLPLIANNAALAIERGIITRELILRMVKTAEMRDPAETGAHVLRVGTYSAEIYSRWAGNKGLDQKETKRVKDLIRLAAMLHDVGKVGVPDAILKKPGKLEPEEFEIIKLHPIFGARLFLNDTGDLDTISKEIVLCHHEKWDGSGYPGRIPDLNAEPPVMGVSLRGEDIPISARIVALADVYDALASKRSYKEPWPEERIFDVIRKGAGAHFDPDVVQAFFQIYDVIRAIREKYRDED